MYVSGPGGSRGRLEYSITEYEGGVDASRIGDVNNEQ